jgi:hypothetical protein
MSTQQFSDAQFPLVSVPFHGTLVMVRLRELTQAQIYACGGSDISLIETFQDKIRLHKKPTMSEIVRYADIQHEITRKALVEPSYDQIMDICKAGIDTEAVKKEAKDIEQLIATLPAGPKKSELVEKVESLRVWIDLLLPNDFIASVVTYALGISKSDIKSLTEDTLYKLAISAKLGNDNPADHISGEFSKFNLEDINRRAWLIYHEKQKDNKDGG